MTSPRSSLATVRDALERMLIIGRALGVEKHGVEIEDALAALDSLDGHVILSREEAGGILGQLRNTADYEEDEGYLRELVDLLAARLEEAK